MKYEINKELINAILDDEIKDIYFAPNGRFFETWNGVIDNRVNINDFFFMCKEWANKNEYRLLTGSHDYNNQIICNIYKDFDYIDDYCEQIKSESEQQAVFDACQWILENKVTK